MNKRAIADRTPSAIDIHVAQRIKARRKLLGISQERIASELGVSFQNIQKVESGLQRVSAGRLYEIARLMNVPTSFFFEGLEADIGTLETANPMEETWAMELVREASMLPPDARKSLHEFVRGARGAR